MSSEQYKHVCPRCWYETYNSWAMSTHDCKQDQEEKKMNKVNYFEAIGLNKPFRPIGTQRWFGSSSEVRDFILGSVPIQRNLEQYGHVLYGKIMRFISSDFEIKKEPRKYFALKSGEEFVGKLFNSLSEAEYYCQELLRNQGIAQYDPSKVGSSFSLVELVEVIK